MGYSYGTEAAMEQILESLLSAGTQMLVSSLVGIVTYVFVALSLYTIASRRGIKKAWMAWIPVLDVWILGSISDQFRYVVRGENKSKRKALLALNLICTVIGILIVVLFLGTLIGTISLAWNHVSEERLIQGLLGGVAGIAGVSLVLLVFAIAKTVIYYMALYDVYTSCDPNNNVLYLVLSIIPMVSTIALPLLLFLCREKDGGMPPRRDQPQYEAPDAGWQQEVRQAKQEWKEESPLWTSQPEEPSGPWNQNPSEE